MQISAIYRQMGGNGADDGKELYNSVRNTRRKAAIREGEKQYDYRKHEVTKPAKRPDKEVFVPTGEKNPVTGEDVLRKDWVSPVRAPIPVQQYIIAQKASFAAGSGVRLRPSDETSQVFKDVYRNWYANKTDFYLRDIAKWQMADTQVAVIWFGEPGAEQMDDFRIKFLVVSPTLDGSVLEPQFDNFRRLTALGREYMDEETGENIYDLYIDRNPDVEGSKPILRRYRGKGKSYQDIPLPFTKLPVVYWEQERPECDSVKELITEFESGFSDFLTQMGYSADPILFGKGAVLNLPAKGSAGKFIEGSPDADLKYVTPDNATESRDLQFRLLQKYIFSFKRSVLLDLETMQSLSEISGAALDRYLIDAYMDATDRQQGEWGMGVQRMVNFLVAEWKNLRGLTDDSTTVDVEFTKYRVQDIKENVEIMLLANGNKPLIGHLASITQAGLADDPAVEYDRIKKEEEEASRQQQGTQGELFPETT